MESQAQPYYEESDLRQYIRVLIRRWPLILIVVALAATIGFFVSKWQEPEPTYEATAVVVMGSPRYVLNYDARIQTAAQARMGMAGSTLASLATSDEMLRQVLAEVQDALPETRLTLRSLKRTLAAEAYADAGLLILTGKGSEPAVVAEMVNTWADVFVTYANRVYGVSGGVSFFEAQVAGAKEELDEAQQDVIAYQAQSELEMLENQYKSLGSLQMEYLGEQGRIGTLLQDVEILRAQLGERPGTTPLPFDDQLAIMGLSLKALYGHGDRSNPANVTINDESVWAGRSRAEALTYLEGLQENLQAKLVYLGTQLADMVPSLQDLQERMESSRAEGDQVTQARDLARGIQYMVTRELEEARILNEDTANRAWVASTAEVPLRPLEPPRTLQNTILAAVVGLLIAVGVAFLLEYLEGERQPVEVCEQALDSGAVSD